MRKICVYCGSSEGVRGEYAQSARRLGEVLARRGCELVYGAGCVGLMGILADTVLERGGRVIGVIPKRLGRKVRHAGLSELHETISMHDRKALMFELADAMIAMPGGIGTFEEMLEVYTWGQLGFHEKPLGVLNAAGYYDKMIAFLDHAVEEGFIKPVHRQMLIVENEPEALLDRLEAYQPPQEEKWWLDEDVVD